MDERLIAMVPTSAGAELSEDRVVKAIQAFAGPGDGAPHVVRSQGAEATSFVVTIGGASIAVLVFPFPIPSETLASALGNELFWPDAAQTFAGASGHALLAVINPDVSANRSVRYARALTIVTAGVLTAMNGVGVFWAPADCVIDPQRFKAEAGELRGSDFASSLWFSLRFLPGSTDPKDESIVCQSTGLAAFLGREVECGPYRMNPGEIGRIVLFVARYMASAGPVFADGHTLSFGDGNSKDARLALVQSRRGGVEQPVFRLELMAQEALAR
jgi:hypothetical protein